MNVYDTIKIAVKIVFTIVMLAGCAGLFYLSVQHKEAHSLPRQVKPEVIEYSSSYTEAFEFSMEPTADQLMSSIKDFVETPEGGVSWDLFGKTEEVQYSYLDEEGMEWSGVRPKFPDQLSSIDGDEILMQGYMFPLGQEEKQALFLFGPFPMSCPYHYHVTPNLIIEVHAKNPVGFSYDAVNIKGRLELVPKDDEYNVFYRLKNAELVP